MFFDNAFVFIMSADPNPNTIIAIFNG